MAINALRSVGAAVMKDFIPVLYSAKLTKNYYERSILPAIFNTDYQGQFQKMGDVIKIRKPGRVDVVPWKDGDQIAYKEVATDSLEMTIDHGVLWAFKTSKLNDAQTDIKDYKNAWMLDATKQVEKYTENTVIGALLADDIDINNLGANAGVDSGAYNLGTLNAPVIIAKDDNDKTNRNATDFITDFLSVLAEQNVTSDGQAVNFVAPKIYTNRLSKGELKRADLVGSSATTLRMGKQQVFAGDISGAKYFETSYMTPRINANGKKVFPVLACTKEAASFALQFTETWTGELESEVAVGYRGVSVFGSKLIEPRAIAVGWVAFE